MAAIRAVTGLAGVAALGLDSVGGGANIALALGFTGIGTIPLLAAGFDLRTTGRNYLVG